VQRQLPEREASGRQGQDFLEYRERLKELRLKYSLSEYHKMFWQSAEERKARFAGLEESFERQLRL